MSVEKRLVFDVGMRWGEDTAWYLARGFRVVGVEANPQLVPSLCERFAAELASGDVVLVTKAIARDAAPQRFAITPGHPQWGTLDQAFIERYESNVGERVDYVDVEGVRFYSLLEEHGVPYYLKIDIEGFDHLCIEDLHLVADRPSFLSVESIVSSPGSTSARARAELDELVSLGYEHFAYVEQSSLADRDGRVVDGEGPSMPYAHDNGASGPFGRDLWSEWRSQDEAMRRARMLVARYAVLGYNARFSRTFPAKVLRKSLLVAGPRVGRPRAGRPLWYDLHAAHASVDLARRGPG